MVFLCMSPCPVPATLASSLYVTTQSRLSASSWEFFTTLGYEWDVIRGHRPYQWTILVCSLLSSFVVAHIIKRVIDLYLLQIYSITRVATLLSIILNMFGFDSTAPIYCQVSPSLNVQFLYCSQIELCSQGLDHFYSREHLLSTAQATTPNILPSFFLALFFHCLCVRFPVDCTSYVRLLCVLIKSSQARHSKGFWQNRRFGTWRSFSFVITMGVWVADVALLISGKYILQITKESLSTLVRPQVQYG